MYVMELLMSGGHEETKNHSKMYFRKEKILARGYTFM